MTKSYRRRKARARALRHSPRLYRGKLWRLDSGRGQFGTVDLERGVFEPVAFCAGYARGLAFHGDYAVVGLSRPRENRTFQGLGLEAALTAKGAEARTGVLEIDLRTGDTRHWVRLSGVVTELYDVVALPGGGAPDGARVSERRGAAYDFRGVLSHGGGRGVAIGNQRLD